jgi:hypothetical protein
MVVVFAPVSAPEHRHERKPKSMLVNRRTLRIELCDPAGIVFIRTIYSSSTRAPDGYSAHRQKPLAMRKKYGIIGMPIVEVGAVVMPCRFDDRSSEKRGRRMGTNELHRAPPSVEESDLYSALRNVFGPPSRTGGRDLPGQSAGSSRAF